MKSAGWTDKKIAGLSRIKGIRITLLKRYNDMSDIIVRVDKKINEYKQNIRELGLDKGLLHNEEKINRLKTTIKQLENKKAKLHDIDFGGAQHSEYDAILQENSVETVEEKRQLAYDILEVLYAQSHTLAPGTLGFDIWTMFERNENAYKDMTDKTRTYFGVPEDNEYKPTVVSLLGDGEIFYVSSNIIKEDPPSFMHMLSRKMLMTNAEWKKADALRKDPDKKYQVDSMVDGNKFYSTLYHKDETGKKCGLFRDAYDYAQQQSNDPRKIMTDFMMRHTQLVEEKRKKDIVFWFKTQKIMAALAPYIAKSDAPIVFYDTGLKGTFPALLASLVEIYRHNKNKDSIYNGNPSAFGYLFAIDEASEFAFPHLDGSIGKRSSRLVDEAPRFSYFERNISRYGVTPSQPADNLLALIYYHTFLQLKQLK
jgi:hypothetical protein